MPVIKFYTFKVDINMLRHPLLKGRSTALNHWYRCAKCGHICMLDPYEGEIWCSKCDNLHRYEEGGVT